MFRYRCVTFDNEDLKNTNMSNSILIYRNAVFFAILLLEDELSDITRGIYEKAADSPERLPFQENIFN